MDPTLVLRVVDIHSILYSSSLTCEACDVDEGRVASINKYSLESQRGKEMQENEIVR